MPSGNEVIDLLKNSFDATTRSVAVSPHLPAEVRGRLRRRRAGRLTAASTAALAAATLLATTAGAQHSTPGSGGAAVRHGVAGTVHTHDGSVGVGALKTVRLSAFDFKVPAEATVTKTCLPDSDEYATSSTRGEVFALVRDGHGSFRDTAAGNPCVGATFAFIKTPPPAVDRVTTPGQPTVFITAAAGGTRAGYVLLTGRDSVAAALAVGGRTGRYAMVMTIPSDNDQPVLVAGLRQYHPGGR